LIKDVPPGGEITLTILVQMFELSFSS